MLGPREFVLVGILPGYLLTSQSHMSRLVCHPRQCSLALGLMAYGIIDLGMRIAGWVETTYLDEDFRVGRGDKGSVFVTARLGKAKEAAPQPAAAVAQR